MSGYMFPSLQALFFIFLFLPVAQKKHAADDVQAEACCYDLLDGISLPINMVLFNKKTWESPHPSIRAFYYHADTMKEVLLYSE